MPGRFAPEIPLPSYGFVPGRNERPAERELPTDAAFAYGVDCWNAGYYWEAHEAWETLWIESRDPVLQGLIQCAAACVKLLQGNRDAFERVRTRALARLVESQDYGDFAAAFASVDDLDDRPLLRT